MYDSCILLTESPSRPQQPQQSLSSPQPLINSWKAHWMGQICHDEIICFHFVHSYLKFSWMICPQASKSNFQKSWPKVILVEEERNFCFLRQKTLWHFCVIKFGSMPHLHKTAEQLRNPLSFLCILKLLLPKKLDSMMPGLPFHLWIWRVNISCRSSWLQTSCLILLVKKVNKDSSTVTFRWFFMLSSTFLCL